MFKYQREQRQLKKLLNKHPEYKEWYLNQLLANTIEEEWRNFRNIPALSVD